MSSWLRYSVSLVK